MAFIVGALFSTIMFFALVYKNQVKADNDVYKITLTECLALNNTLDDMPRER